VPGCVHTDLLANKLIEDPFYRDNEKKQQWIDKKDWEYRTTFPVTAQTLAHENVELLFDGLDTYAEVYLNEQLVLKADNMFRTWRVNVKPTLKTGDNSLRILFRSPVNEILPLMAKLDYKLSRSARSSENESTTMSAPAVTSVSLLKVVVIAAEKQPAAFAARSPFTESSMIQQSAALRPSFCRAIRNTSGSGFGR